MSNNYFKFKQFTIEQDGCAMKVGTDGCLLGGWFDTAQSHNILDIGCGSGLISIMAAQRCKASITGIEIDSNATLQATKNVNNSPWKDRIKIVNADYLEYTTTELFDTIVSNPPFFIKSLKCNDSSRTLARHSDTLNSNDFFSHAAKISTADARISIIIPCDILHEWATSAELHGFFESRKTYVKTTPRKQPKRVLVEFKRGCYAIPLENTLVLEEEPGTYSKEAAEILRDFYLRFE